MPQEFLDQNMRKRLEQLALISRKVTTGRLKGERRSRRHGTSTDFADFRNYVAGDDLRFLDWKIFGRLEKLFIKIFLEEEDLHVNILIDTSPSMEFGEPSKLLYAKRVAAAIGYVCLAKMDSLTVQAFASGLGPAFGPKRGKANTARYFSFLEGLQTSGRTGLLDSFKTFARAHRSRGMAIVISDFYDFDGYEEALRQLIAGDFEVLAVHVLSPEELKPTHQGDIRLVDCEFNVAADISMSAGMLDAYARTVNAFCSGLKNYIVGRGGCYLLTSTAVPVDRLVLDVLRRRGILR